ncbi:hypothetical protein F383_34702 [Gossypium arboreum]|uniref:Uncharacterized protein n=1 Tax=Gossypium arboreum TaxID=29729 RepID=A0A0B0MZ16_GOSAR|nr:hypothetical protein F383_34702 [Gossypium arboreum]
MFSQLMHSFSPLHQTPPPSKVPCAMAADDMSTTQIWWTWGVGRAIRYLAGHARWSVWW